MQSDSKGHSHGAGGHNHVSLRAGNRHRTALKVSFLLITTFFIVELLAGLATHSLALLSDAGHMFTDVIGLGMALAAISFANRHEGRRLASSSNTFGLYRLEILAALLNSVLLIVVAVYVLFEAIKRFSEPADIQSGPMLAVAVAGLVVNLIAFALLRSGATESLNVSAAYTEVLADLLGSVGAIAAALAVRILGWEQADLVIGTLIGLWILPRAIALGRQAIRVLLQAAPVGLDIAKLKAELASIPGVADVHDLHVWTLTSEMDAATAHLITHDEASTSTVLALARDLLSADYKIDHVTFQVEQAGTCRETSW